MKYFCLIILALLILSCSEPPTRDNPYDLAYDLPEPENLQVEHISLTTKKVTWEYELENIDGFILSRKQNENWTEIASIAADKRSYIDTLSINEIVQYKIVAYADQNYSDEMVSDYFDNTIPSPENLLLEIVNENEIRLTWEYEIEGIEGFRIEKEEAGGDWQLYADYIAAELREWEDNNCSYWDNYRIRAYYQGYESEASNEVMFEIVDMIYVEGGTFEMGDHFNEGNSDELPVHEVTLSSFYIGQFEVTQSEYESVMSINPAYGYGVGDDYPVYYVSWYDAVEYCNVLSEQEGLTPCYNLSDWSCDFDANGFRLPTEAEWEYAARGGVNWEDNYRYTGTTDDLDDYAWYSSNSGGQTHEVGTKFPNQLDIYDMSGNVWEWCNDWYLHSYYCSSPDINPTGPDSGPFHVARGGSWCYHATCCRVAYRDISNPGAGDHYVGFRLARAVE